MMIIDEACGPPFSFLRAAVALTSEGTWDQGYPPPFGQTNASENITFPQLRVGG